MAYDKDQILVGMEVVDADGAKVGNLVRHEDRLGYFETQGTFFGPSYIPFSAVESILPDRIRLNERLARLETAVPLPAGPRAALPTAEAFERVRALFATLEFKSLLGRLPSAT